MTGWSGLAANWRVEDGVITGENTADKPLKNNTFLVCDKKVSDFELNLEFRIMGGNSGIQYRSKLIDAEKFIVGGYQADIDSTGKYAGMLYEERGRGILMGPGEKVRIGATIMVDDAKKAGAKKKQTAVEKLPGATPPAEILAAYKLGEWNDFVVIAEGNHLRHYLIGKLTADVIDTDSTLGAAAGVIAFQLHTGPPMTVQFKNVRLKTLP